MIILNSLKGTSYLMRCKNRQLTRSNSHGRITKKINPFPCSVMKRDCLEKVEMDILPDCIWCGKMSTYKAAILPTATSISIIGTLLQGRAKKWSPDLENFVHAVTFRFCLNLPKNIPATWGPRHGLANLCTMNVIRSVLMRSVRKAVGTSIPETKLIEQRRYRKQPKAEFPKIITI